jgi:alpha-tubulin suppressor-like RCC1 family protein
VKGIDNAVEVAAGGNHTCALLQDGTVECWGENNHGELGTGDQQMRTRPSQVQSLSDVIEIGVGQHHSCAITTIREAFCWGLNDDGQLGDGSTNQSNTPVAVQ